MISIAKNTVHLLLSIFLFRHVKNKSLVSLSFGSFGQHFFLIFRRDVGGFIPWLDVSMASLHHGTEVVLNLSFYQLDVCVLHELL